MSVELPSMNIERIREALEAGPTPGEWSLKTVPTSDGSCHKIGPFPSASRVHSETHACVYAIGIRLGIDDSTPVARELLANARLIAACSPANMSAILAHIEAQAFENEQLREMLAHLYAGSDLYCDDGELQDARATPFIDFKRDSVADIRYAMVERNERKEQR